MDDADINRLMIEKLDSSKGLTALLLEVADELISQFRLDVDDPQVRKRAFAFANELVEANVIGTTPGPLAVREMIRWVFEVARRRRPRV